MSLYSQFKTGGSGGSATILAGTDTAVSTSTGATLIWNTSTLETVTGRGSTTTSTINIVNTTSAVSTTTGALTVRGGVGVGGALYASEIYANNAQVITTATVELFSVIRSISAGTDISVNTTTGDIIVSDIATLATVTARGSTSSQRINLTNTTTSIRETTGALVVAGGVGVGKDVYIGNTLYVSTVTSLSYGSGVTLSPYSTTIFSGKTIASGSIAVSKAAQQSVIVNSSGTTFDASSSTNWTVEFWWNNSSPQGDGMFFIGRNTSEDKFYISWTTDNNFSVGSTIGNIITANRTITYDAWNHIAVVNSGTSLTAFVNGTAVGQTANTISPQSITQFCIGRRPGTSQFSSGNYSNIRVVTNTAVYTGNFTPPNVPLRAILGTQVLLSTVNGPNFLVDSSDNNYPVTNFNNSTNSANSPFVVTSEKRWVFSPAGTIVFPDSTTQSSAWDPSNIVNITNLTASTSTANGALIVAGGVGIAEKLNVGSTATFLNSVLIKTTLMETTITQVNTTATTLVDSFSATKYRSCKNYIQLQDGTAFGVTEIVLLQDTNNNVYKSEYGIINTDGEKGIFTADLSNGMVNLYFTANIASNKTITVVKTALAA